MDGVSLHRHRNPKMVSILIGQSAEAKSNQPVPSTALSFSSTVGKQSKNSLARKFLSACEKT